jgi:hypothetical protein
MMLTHGRFKAKTGCWRKSYLVSYHWVDDVHKSIVWRMAWKMGWYG